MLWTIRRSSHLEVFIGKGVLKIRSKFTTEHPCGSAISIKLLCNFIEITLWHGCIFPEHFFVTPLDDCFCICKSSYFQMLNISLNNAKYPTPVYIQNSSDSTVKISEILEKMRSQEINF